MRAILLRKEQFRDAKIALRVDIDCFARIDFEHHWPLSDATVIGLQRRAAEEINAGILQEHRRQVLRSKKDSRVVINRSSQSIPQPRLHARDGKKTVTAG